MALKRKKMRKKVAKQLRAAAALMTQTNPHETKKTYKRLKSVHKEIKQGK